MKLPARWLTILGAFVAGGLVGAGGVIANQEVGRITSTDAFCTSCHSMRMVAAEPHFTRSAHRANAAGVRASCADCHIPRNNWFVETWTHYKFAIRDVIAEKTHSYSDAQLWKARRLQLAGEVRQAMHAQDSVTCRSCHDATAIAPKSEAGRAAHALLNRGGVTCIDCHAGLVHAPADMAVPAKP